MMKKYKSLMGNQKILRQPIGIKWIDCYIDEIFFFMTFQNFVSQILNKVDVQF